MKKSLIISIPINGVTGGFIRSYKVLQHLVNILSSYDIDVYVYTPLTPIIKIIIEGNIKQAINTIKYVMKLNDEMMSNYISNKYINNIIYKYIKCKKLFSKNTRRVIGFGPCYLRSIQHIENKTIDLYIKKIKNIDFIYTTNEGIEAIYSLIKFISKYKVPSSIMLQSAPYFDPSFNLRMLNFKVLSSYYLNNWIRNNIQSLIKKRLLRLVMAVSPVPFLASKSLFHSLKENHVPMYVPRPPVAFDSHLLINRSDLRRGPVAIFFARLNPLKGMYDLLYIWNIVEKRVPDAELYVLGAFDSYRYRDDFFSIIKKLNLKKIYYYGYVDHSKIHRFLRIAKVLIYPSYFDAFPLAVLEALASGVSVVAYNIPALRYAYRGLPPVKLVPIGDINSMADEVSKILLMNDADYEYMHRDPRVEEFLATHSSWEKVAKAEAGALLRYLVNPGTARS